MIMRGDTMSTQRLLFVFLLVMSMVLAGCGPNKEELAAQIATSVAATIEAVPTSTAYPTSTPFPTLTPYPTSTAYPTATRFPTLTPYPTTRPISIGLWVTGHFFSIRVDRVHSEKTLDALKPTKDVFVVVDISWKTSGLAEKHQISGIDFALIDSAGKEYGISGMIYDKDFHTTADATYQKGKWMYSQVSGTSNSTMRLVFDVPSSVISSNSSLWFQDMPTIELGRIS
jgi:hypothetical protein